jgi:hypothetical protein
MFRASAPGPPRPVCLLIELLAVIAADTNPPTDEELADDAQRT